ncbi:max dimerization protein 3 isoform X1 [Cricetulus griseus]|uniref:Max dimerization protein 3 n=1 Tax=Cricetulus griseus TaxID=10029 RepID=A0A9J7JIY2_CRIGR|nr:max dimerization protein 3 isoform X4 [Cricetulus griseus]XP_035301240.1 max dimerization protein 3 isoform X1 [Cricetulus griseus]
MEPVASNIQVLLQAAEFLERREREAEHGYASLCPHHGPGAVYRRRKRPLQAPGALNSGRSAHNELEKRRRAQLKRCLEQLRQQMPLGVDCPRYTTLSLLRRARVHIQVDEMCYLEVVDGKWQDAGSIPSGLAPARLLSTLHKLEEQEQQAQRLKEKLRSEQQSLQQQLEQLQGLPGAGERDRPRADSLDSSVLSSERSDSDQEDVEVDVESLVFGTETELLPRLSTSQGLGYSHSTSTWL